MARRPINRKTQRDLASVTPLGSPGAPEITGFTVPDTSQVPFVVSTASFGPRDVATSQGDEDGSDQAFPASLVGLDRQRFYRKRTGGWRPTQYADPIVMHSALAYGDITGAPQEETFDELEHEVKFQDVNPNYLAGYSSPLGQSDAPAGPIGGSEHGGIRLDDYANHGFKVQLPDKIGVPTDLGHDPKSYIFFDFSRPFDQLASQRLYGIKGVYGMAAVGEPKMTVNEAVGKFPAPGMTAFSTQVPTDRSIPDIWYQEELNSQSTHKRSRARF